MALKWQRKRVFCLLVVFGSLAWTVKIFSSMDSDKVYRQKSGSRYLPKNAKKKHFQSMDQEQVPEPPNVIQLKNNELEIAHRNLSYSRETHPWMFPRPLSELEENVVPNQVFFVWCENRTFTFNDYLSVLSAWKLLEPDKLEVHYATDIQTDKYNQWFMELNQTIPVFTLKFIKRTKSICFNPLYYALEVLSDRGGVYMHFSTVLLRPVHFLRKRNFSMAFNEAGDVAFIVSRIQCRHLRHVLRKANPGHRDTIAMLKDTFKMSELCPSLSKSFPLVIENADTDTITCVTTSLKFGLKPLDLWRVRNRELSLLRDMYYMELGREKDCTYSTAKRETIPFIVHYVWFGASEFSFRMYLSFLSVVHVAKAERIFIHCDLYLTGEYWRTVSRHPKVTVVYREPPRHIFGRNILYTQHLSDVVRADVLEKYGGIYMDWDVLWLRSPAALLTSGHEAVVNQDHMARPPFIDVLNLGVLLAGPRSRFVRLWRWELRNYRSKDFFYNALELPFKVYERHPDTVKIEERLQVMCFWLKCHPIFHPDHKDWQRAQPFDWRTDVYSIHFTHPDPDEFQSIVTLVNASSSGSTFADIGMFILNESGELDIK